MIEPEAVIDPEAVPPTARTRRHRRAVVAGVTLLAVVAGALALGGGSPEAKPLALMAGNGAGGAESMAAKTGAPAPVAPALGMAADSRSALYPYGGWGLKFEVEGTLPELPDHAAAWNVNGPDLDRAAVVRIADALGVQGTPVQRDGGWFVETGDWILNAFGGATLGKGAGWSINLYRNHHDGRPKGAAGNDAPSGPAISRDDAERRVRDLLDRMGAPRASWKVENTDTEIGIGWACAAPALTSEEMKKLEAEKLRQVEAANTASPVSATSSASGAQTTPAPPASDPEVIARPTPADKPLPGGGVASCPPPPAPVKGFNVALHPLLDGRRADWPVWNVTMRSDGRIENLYGSWVTFERGGNYKLRGVTAALKDLQSPGVPYATDAPAAIEPAAAIDPAIPQPAVGSASNAAEIGQGSAVGSDGAAVAGTAGAAGSAPGRRPLRDGVASSPAVDLPAEAPVCPPAPMPLPAQYDKATSTMAPTCAPPAPQVVKITGVALGLIQTSVFEEGEVRLALVPSYRFVGHFDNGTPWETSVLALHPDAIAPPPDFPVTDGVRSGGATGIGKAVPPTPAPEPAIARDSSQ